MGRCAAVHGQCCIVLYTRTHAHMHNLHALLVSIHVHVHVHVQISQPTILDLTNREGSLS